MAASEMLPAAYRPNALNASMARNKPAKVQPKSRAAFRSSIG